MAETINDQETEEPVAADTQENVGTEEETSFQNAFEEKLNNILKEPVAKQTKKAAKKIVEKEEAPVQKEDSSPLDFNNLFEDVYGSIFDPEKDEEKMKALKAAVGSDPSLEQMAIESPEKFALYFYRLT